MTKIGRLFHDGWGLRLWVCLVAVAAALVLVVGGLVAGLGYLERRSCHEAVAALNRDSRWGYFSGCLVDDGDRWVPLDNWRRNEQSKEDR